MTGQRKGAAIAMTDAERDAFLRAQPVCRVATLGPGGHPHVSALWFVWDGTALWLNSLTRSQRWADIGRDPRLSVMPGLRSEERAEGTAPWSRAGGTRAANRALTPWPRYENLLLIFENIILVECGR